MIKIVEGNLLEAPETILVQQVNCQGKMGAGLALQIRKKYPKVYSDYKMLCDRWEPAALLGHVQIVKLENNKYVVNLFSQLNYGRGKKQTDYAAFTKALETLRIKNIMNIPMAFPYGIGCGLAGGDWNTIYNIIENELEDREVTIYKLK